jgi:hypothetical protein
VSRKLEVGIQREAGVYARNRLLQPLAIIFATHDLRLTAHDWLDK